MFFLMLLSINSFEFKIFFFNIVIVCCFYLHLSVVDSSSLFQGIFALFL